VGRRAGQPTLTRERILATALQVIDAHGLEALSMRRLGAELGVDPMTVYHHLPGKDAVVRGVVAQVFAEMPLPASNGPWRDRVRAWAQTYRALARAHPNLVLRMVSDPAAVAIAAERINVSLYAALEASGLAPEYASRIADVIVDYINGFVLAEASQGPTQAGFDFGIDLILAGATRNGE
jgi:TetR/AcrR family tetracycline transcriptional repressor